MARWMKLLGILLLLLGVAGSAWCTWGVLQDDDYYRALLASGKYPGNVLYTTELKMAEPRHMLLLAGAFASAPLGLVLGSICLGVGALLARAAVVGVMLLGLALRPGAAWAGESASLPPAAQAAQLAPRPLSFTFGASVSSPFDLGRPDEQVTGENPRLYSDGRSQEAFHVDLVQLGATARRGRGSARAKVDYGRWARVVSDNLDGDFALQELILAVDAGPFVASAGRLPTPIGYESLEPWANPNISRSRAWFFQPVSHDGVSLAGSTGGWQGMLGVVNGMRVSDAGQENPDDEYGVLASVAHALGDGEARLSAIWSDEHDTTRYVEANAVLAGRRGAWRYGLEGTWLDGHLHRRPVAVPVPLDLSVGDVTGYGGGTWRDLSADLRLSWTHQRGTNAAFARRNEESIVSFTVTGGWRIVDGVVLRAEYRVDSAGAPVFDDHDSLAGLAGPVGQDDLAQVVSVQLYWTPEAAGR